MVAVTAEGVAPQVGSSTGKAAVSNRDSAVRGPTTNHAMVRRTEIARTATVPPRRAVNEGVPVRDNIAVHDRLAGSADGR